MTDDLLHNMGTDSVERSVGVLIGRIDGLSLMITNLHGEVKSLRNDFNTMEKGRLSALEVKFATMSTEIGMKSRNSAMLYGAITAIIGNVIVGLVLWALIHTAGSAPSIG